MAEGDKKPWLAPYRWQKGQSGNPGGRPRQKPISDAYKQALQFTDANGVTFAQLIAQAMLEKAMRGDVAATKEVTDRVEGSVRQAMDILFGGLTDAQLAEFLAAQYGNAGSGDVGSDAPGVGPARVDADGTDDESTGRDGGDVEATAGTTDDGIQQ